MQPNTHFFNHYLAANPPFGDEWRYTLDIKKQVFMLCGLHKLYIFAL